MSSTGVRLKDYSILLAWRILVIVFLLLLPLPTVYGFGHSGSDVFNNPSGPMLLYPVTSDIDLTGKKVLAFKWRRYDLGNIREYDFRLYKGYDTTEAGLILKKKFSVDEYPIELPVAQFELNQVYTWVLTETLDNGQKSDRSFSSFKIIKK